MLAIDSDNQEIERSLDDLGKLVSTLGGYVNPALQIRCESGDLSIETPRDFDSREPLITLPEQSLLPLDEVEFALAGDDICIASTSSELSHERRRLFELMLQIYNHANKVRDFRATFPWTAFASDPEPLSRIIGVRKASKLDRYREHLAAEKFDELLIEGLLGARYINFKTSGADDYRPVLMPIMDFMNHDYRSPGFVSKPDRRFGKTLSVIHSRPISGSRECFVRYGRYDALDTYLTYNYIDESVSFVCSVPLEIRLSKIGTIKVLGFMARDYPGKLPAAVADLKAFMPRVGRSGDNVVSATHLLIPCGKWPNALRRVLASLIHTLNDDVKDEALTDLTLEAESLVLSENMKFYSELGAYLATYTSKSELSAALARANNMVDAQTTKLRQYVFHH